MKRNTLQLLTFIAVSILTTLSVNAANSTLQPINTRLAQTQDAISIELSAWYFSDVKLQEADSFDGWSAGAEIVYPLPFNKSMQLRFILPFRTEGDARVNDSALRDNGEKIDIDGNGGIYEFMTLQFEHQFRNYKDDGINVAYIAGLGMRTDELETNNTNLDHYNHTGRVIVGGVKFDRPIFGEKVQWLTNVGIRYYFDTDDLHSSGKANFAFADLKTAVVFAPLGRYIVPVVELTYLGDFDHNELALKPEIIIPFNDHVSIKMGGIVSLSDEGNQGGGVASIAIDF